MVTFLRQGHTICWTRGFCRVPAVLTGFESLVAGQGRAGQVIGRAGQGSRRTKGR